MRVKLGKTGLTVSKLCFGTLTISPLQRNLPDTQSVALLNSAYDKGVNFFDTAELYDNYAVLGKALANKPDAVIATKCYAYDAKTAQASLTKAQKKLNREVIDIFLLHEQESALTLKGHKEAVDFFANKKAQGVIKAFGISTHHVAGVKAANALAQVDIIHAICNINGFGIVDGKQSAMNAALAEAKALGKGVYGMKPLGGGHLINQREKALAYVLAQPSVDAVAVGIQSQAELSYNLAVFNGKTPYGAADMQDRRLFIHHDWCNRCGTCVARCQQNALTMTDTGVTIDHDACVLCSYCAADCKQLAIKVL